MKKSVYEVAESKFKDVSAYVILKDGKHVANITLKYPRDGVGRLFGFLHCYQTEKVQAFVGGCGYDKRTAVIQSLAGKALQLEQLKNNDVKPMFLDFKLLCQTMSKNDGGWDIGLYGLGFEIIRVI